MLLIYLYNTFATNNEAKPGIFAMARYICFDTKQRNEDAGQRLLEVKTRRSSFIQQLLK